MRRIAGLVLMLGLVVGCQSERPVVNPNLAVSAGQPVETVRVSRIVDGDTFEIADGRRIRVLGIDSCESKTAGGKRASLQARGLLMAGPVTLSREYGVDNDPYNRLLRYVRLGDGRDFGTVMVVQNHTYVYPKKNDASRGYVSELRRLDKDGRFC